MCRRLRLWLSIGVLALSGACGEAVSSGQEPNLSRESSRPVTKLLVFVEENHSLDQMRSQMPYTFGLAKRFGYADNYVAITYPSLPNYLAITGGKTYGITDDDPPLAHPVDGTSVFGGAISQGKSAVVYADGMPENCAIEDGGDGYVVKHNPWPYFVSERTDCQAHDLPIAELDVAIADAQLPDIGLVVPNLCHDAHDCDLSVADDWFKGYMSKVFSGRDWKSGHLAVVLTADEDDHSLGNKVLTVVIHPSQNGNVVSRRLDHYSLTRLYEDVVGAPHLYNSRSAASMSEAFGLPIG